MIGVGRMGRRVGRREEGKERKGKESEEMMGRKKDVMEGAWGRGGGTDEGGEEWEQG